MESVKPMVTIGIALKALRSLPRLLPQTMKPVTPVENAKPMATTGTVPKVSKSHPHRHHPARPQKTSRVSARPMVITGIVLKASLSLLPLRRQALQRRRTSQQLLRELRSPVLLAQAPWAWLCLS
jgi:hypothetical protein